MSSDHRSDLQSVYDLALQRLEEVRAAWMEEGQPLTSAAGSQGQVIEDPLAKLLRESEAHVARLANLLMPAKSPGRKATAVVAPFEPSRARRLRVAKAGSGRSAE